MADRKRIHRAIIASAAVLGVLASACGAGASAGDSDLVVPARPHVVQDPDDPAARNYVPSTFASGATVEGRAFIVRDPENPHWSGYRYIPNLGETAPSLVPTPGAAVVGSRAWIVRDPDNPYWTGR